MSNKNILPAVLITLLIGLSSCSMHVVQGTPYHVWGPSRHTRHHWGRERHVHIRHMYWGSHKYGNRPYRGRGQFRY